MVVTPYRPLGRKNLMTFFASASNITSSRRDCRFICLGRFTRPWRLLAGLNFTLPVAVSLKRFLALLLVFILGIFVFLQRVSRVAMAHGHALTRPRGGFRRTRAYTDGLMPLQGGGFHPGQRV